MKSVEKAESLKSRIMEVKDSFSIRQLVMVALVLFCTAANIIMDYMAPGFAASVFANPAYWISLIVQQGAIILIMLCVYAFMIEKESQSNDDIKKLKQLLATAHAKLSEYDLTQKFDDYVMVKAVETGFDVSFDKPMGTSKGVMDLLERRMASPFRSKPV